jgi:hypothetical protein
LKTRLLVPIALALLASPVTAQIASNRAGAGVAFETYRFSDDERIDIQSLTLLSFPFGAAVALSRRVELQVTGAWARGELSRPDGSSATISGLTDTDVRLSATLGRDVVTITAIAQLPTGVSELTTDEADAAGMFAADVLPFRITNWGAGGGIGLSTALAQPVGEFAVGLSLGYVVAREFEPVADDFQYRPGSQLHVRAAIDRTFGTSAKGALSITYQRFGEDQADGENLFQTGDRIQGLASWSFIAGDLGSGVVYAGYLHRSEGEYLDFDELEPAQRLVFGGVGARLPMGTSVIMPALDMRLHGGDEGAGSGYTLGLGGSVEVPMGWAVLIPTLRGRFGNVELSSGLDSGFTGGEVGLTVRF